MVSVQSFVQSAKRSSGLFGGPVWGIEEETHQATSKSTGNGNGHNPGENEQADTLPVDSLVGTIAKTDTDGSTGDTHRSGDWESELRKDEDGDGSTHLH